MQLSEGNGHKNWTLLRLLFLFIGNVVPENDDTWSVILDLKDIVAHLICCFGPLVDFWTFCFEAKLNFF